MLNPNYATQADRATFGHPDPFVKVMVAKLVWWIGFTMGIEVTVMQIMKQKDCDSIDHIIRVD